MDLIKSAYDVLAVPSDAGPSQIQAAFFDRRYELSENMSKDGAGEGGQGQELGPWERHLAERSMDAVVSAYRILSDPKIRAEYDARIGIGGSPRGSPRGFASLDRSGVSGS